MTAIVHHDDAAVLVEAIANPDTPYVLALIGLPGCEPCARLQALIALRVAERSDIQAHMIHVDPEDEDHLKLLAMLRVSTFPSLYLSQYGTLRKGWTGFAAGSSHEEADALMIASIREATP